MPDTPDLADLQERRRKAAEEVETLDHAIASVEAMNRTEFVDASCPHCEFVVHEADGLEFHLRDVHPNPIIYPDISNS